MIAFILHQIFQAIIKIKQLENSFEEERKRHEALVSSNNEKWKRECDDVKERFGKEKQTFEAKVLIVVLRLEIEA